MSAHRKPRREPLSARLLRRASLNIHPPTHAGRHQFMHDGELCREAAERLMKLEGFFAAMETMVSDAREDE